MPTLPAIPDAWRPAKHIPAARVEEVLKRGTHFGLRDVTPEPARAAVYVDCKRTDGRTEEADDRFMAEALALGLTVHRP